MVEKGEKTEVGESENERREVRGGERQKNGIRRDAESSGEGTLVQRAWGGGGRWLGR